MNQVVRQVGPAPIVEGQPEDFPLLARAIGFAGSAILITDMHDRVVWANEAFTCLSGYPMEEVIGTTRAQLHGGIEQAGPDRSAGLPLIGHGDAWRQELTSRRPDGSCYVTDEIVTPVVDQFGVITHFVCILHDVTQSKADQQQQRALASQDVLTGLACRAHMLELFERALKEAQHGGRVMATLFVDLDGFKGVNDIHGHHIGDALLKAVAARLQSAVRCSDTIARFGGDEFVILLPAIARRGVARRLGRKIVKLAAQPFAIGSECHTLSASVGIAFYPEHGATCESLLISADRAMYRAKRHGGSQYRLADHAADARIPSRAPRPHLAPQP
jgi:diguanylate cyclase (GGDEF)-like protein/PAS domain S-box-containing protein